MAQSGERNASGCVNLTRRGTLVTPVESHCSPLNSVVMPHPLHKTQHSHRSRLSFGLVFTALATLCVGCTRAPEPEFVPSEATMRLMPEARDGITVEGDDGQEVVLPGVSQAVTNHFGTLAEPKSWPILPIDFGGIKATVTEVVSPASADSDEAAGAVKPVDKVTLVVKPEQDAKLPPLTKESSIGWTEGAYEGRLDQVVSIDPKTSQVTLAGTFEDGLPEAGDQLLINPGAVLEKGQALYERHCVHCHGAGGAGDGPTAKYLFPKPRDYRLGKFKFTSTGGTEKASRADILEILERGIPGTSMPAFRLLPEDELHAITEYVRWLAMRGEYENVLAETGIGAYELTSKTYEERIANGDAREDILEEVKEFLEYDVAEGGFGQDIADAWSNANEEAALVVPQASRVADTPESRARGRALYLSDKAKCASCHGPYGKGNGPQAETFQNDPRTGTTYPLPGLYDDWGNPLPPRDLTQGIYRGGRRPIDVYRRIYAGIKGTPMPAFGGSLTDEEIWDLVNYVLHAPYDAVPDPGSGKTLVQAGH